MTKKHYVIDKGFGSVRHEHREKKRPLPTKEDNLLLANSLNIGYYLITPLLIGVFFGVAADNYFKTKPAYTAVFIILGVMSTFYNLGKIIKEN